MLLKPNTDVVDGAIITPDGTVANKPTLILSDDDAAVFRAYKKILRRLGWSEAVFCNQCFEGNLNDGMRVQVTDGQIVAVCNHRIVYYHGQSF